MIARVFPRRTNATPDDTYAFVGEPDFSGLPEDITEIHISVSFTWDLPRAEELAVFAARNSDLKQLYALDSALWPCSSKICMEMRQHKSGGNFRDYGRGQLSFTRSRIERRCEK
jgi:hypothetical protein